MSKTSEVVIYRQNNIKLNIFLFLS